MAIKCIDVCKTLNCELCKTVGMKMTNKANEIKHEK